MPNRPLGVNRCAIRPPPIRATLSIRRFRKPILPSRTLAIRRDVKGAPRERWPLA